MYMYTVYMICFNLHHSGTQFFPGNLDIFFDPKIRQLHFPGGYAMLGREKNAALTSAENGCGVRTLIISVHRKRVWCADVHYLTSKSQFTVCDLFIV
jgi:hypothetical protein